MTTQLKGLLRSHHCGELRKDHVGQAVTICGWVNKYRDLGGLHFLDVRDKHGLTQVSFEKWEKEGKDLNLLKEISHEAVVLAHGVVSARPASAVNATMPTGEVEVMVERFEVLSPADKDRLPFLPTGQIEATEDLRLKYRYLDIRSKRLQDILALRSQTCAKVRNFLLAESFTEVETPILYKSTPEGARDYIVPSRVHPGKVYALPQSPQTLKQLLMIGGTDKYFQICRCFRDEDLRADRQPEFSQVDIEVSFATQEYMKNLATGLVIDMFGLDKNFTFPTMSFDEAMARYGSDKPDVRFGLEHVDVTVLFAKSDFSIFSTLANHSPRGLIKAIFLPASAGQMTRKDLDGLVDVVKPFGGKGVAFFKIENGALSGGISKFITPEIQKELDRHQNGENSGVWMFCGDLMPEKTHAQADAVRRLLGQKFELYQKEYAFLWVYDFPLLEYDHEEKRYAARHHPFTSPKASKIQGFLDGSEDLGLLAAEAYDLVCNGYEIAGGSVRIHNPKVQNRMFEVLGMSEEEIQKQFGFFVEALKYGTPPHAGMAFGLDRLIMLLAKTDSIRDVIAFPKTTSASDLMAQCPSSPNAAQLKELKMKWDVEKA